MKNTYKISDFTWEKNIGSSEISSLGLQELTKEIVIVGRQEKTFVFSHPLRDKEHNIQGWVYYSECNNFKVTIFND